MRKAFHLTGLAILVLAAAPAEAIRLPFFHSSAPPAPTAEQRKEMTGLSSCGLAHVHDQFYDRPGGYLSARASRKGREGYYLLNESGAIFVPLSKTDLATQEVAIKQKVLFPGAKEATYLAVMGFNDPDDFGPYAEPASARLEEGSYTNPDPTSVPVDEALEAIRHRAKENLLKELKSEVASLQRLKAHPGDLLADKTLWLDSVARALHEDPKHWSRHVAISVKSSVEYPRTEGGMVQAQLSGCPLTLSPEIAAVSAQARSLASELARLPEYDLRPLEKALARSRIRLVSLSPLTGKNKGFQELVRIIHQHLPAPRVPASAK